MNLTKFLKQPASLTAKYTAEQLASFIHDVARVLPEKHRADFLRRLKEADAVGQGAQEERDRCSVSTIGSDYEAIRKKFATVHPALYLELLEHPKETNPKSWRSREKRL